MKFQMVRVSWILITLGTMLLAVPATAQDITTSLRGHWPLVEASGTTAADSATTPHNGTYTNGVALATSTAAPSDGAISDMFDGSNDYVAIPNEANFDITGAITVACSIKVEVFDVDL